VTNIQAEQVHSEYLSQKDSVLAKVYFEDVNDPVEGGGGGVPAKPLKKNN
jgi:hypothetical protein